MIRFVLVTYPRCGSHLLATALEDRGDVLAQNEMIHGNYASTFGHGPNVAAKLYRMFWRHPRHTWDRSKFDLPYNLNCDPQDLAAAGFILHRCMSNLIPNHPRLHHSHFGRGLWSVIAADKDVKIIFVHRENQLKRRVSELAAEGAGKWQLYKKDSHGRKVNVDMSKGGLMKHIRWYNEFYDAAKKLLSDHDSMEVVYEDMTQDLQDVMTRVQEFLGLTPVMEILPRTFKRESRSLGQIIHNFRQVRAKLRGTPYEHYLDEPADEECPVHAKPTPQKK